jgi:hypothetical protein
MSDTGRAPGSLPGTASLFGVEVLTLPVFYLAGVVAAQWLPNPLVEVRFLGEVLLRKVAMALPVRIEQATGNSADVVAGTAVATNSTTPVTIITIPAGRTWCGEVTVSITSTAAAIVAATVDTNGTNAIPASGTIVARVNIGGLTSGGFQANQAFKVKAVAPAGNSITLRLVNTSGTANTSSATANGVLI